MPDAVHLAAQARPTRTAARVVIVSASLAGVLLALAFVLAEHWIRDQLVAAIAVPGVIAIAVAIGALIALVDRGDRFTPLRMLGAWLLLVPAVDGITTALILLTTSERREYIGHAIVQSMVRAELAVALAALVLLWGWLRRQLREAASKVRK